MGWYIFDNSEEKFQNEFRKHLIKLKIDPAMNRYEEKFYTEEKPYGKIITKLIGLANEFGDVWSITSLLHDVGYILEGTISSASTEVENVRVSRGSKVVHDYFNHWFWRKFEVDFRAAQNIANLLDVSVPDFKSSQSLASLGDRLCDIGGCENIRKKLMDRDEFNNKAIMEAYGLNREAFSIWKMYYETYDNGKMKNILEIVKDEYYDAMWKGTNQGFRNLNHGVCSGLIVLQALTFYHEFMWGFELLNWEKFEVKQNTEKDHINCISKQIYNDTKAQIIEEYVPKEMDIRGEPSPIFWFKKVLWATASIAIHDVIQEEYYEKICKKCSDPENVKIKLDDDPLAFLGVLVDALQEWDRYTISGESAFSEKKELLQNTDVDIDIKLDKINFYYLLKKGNGEKNFSKDIKKALNRCLLKWDDLVGIGEKFPYSTCPHCGAPLAERTYQSSEIVIDLECIAFECGHVIVDGKVTVVCNKKSTEP